MLPDRSTPAGLVRYERAYLEWAGQDGSEEVVDVAEVPEAGSHLREVFRYDPPEGFTLVLDDLEAERDSTDVNLHLRVDGIPTRFPARLSVRRLVAGGQHWAVRQELVVSGSFSGAPPQGGRAPAEIVLRMQGRLYPTAELVSWLQLHFEPDTSSLSKVQRNVYLHLYREGGTWTPREVGGDLGSELCSREPRHVLWELQSKGFVEKLARGHYQAVYPEDQSR